MWVSNIHLHARFFTLENCNAKHEREGYFELQSFCDDKSMRLIMPCRVLHIPHPSSLTFMSVEIMRREFEADRDRPRISLPILDEYERKATEVFRPNIAIQRAMHTR